MGIASSYSDALAFVLLIALVLLELRHLQPQQFTIRVVRSPDGALPLSDQQY